MEQCMGKLLSSVVQDALELPPLERAQLLEEIYRSLENAFVSDRTEKWAAEAESRIDAFENGEIGTRPYREVRESLDR